MATSHLRSASAQDISVIWILYSGEAKLLIYSQQASNTYLIFLSRTRFSSKFTLLNFIKLYIN